jgi:hypothetical protein
MSMAASLHEAPEGNTHGPSTTTGPLALGTEPFSITARVHSTLSLDSTLGDIISRFDPSSRTGFSLGVNTQAIVSSQANSRQLHFSVDGGGSEGQWVDCGRPGNCIQLTSLVSYHGSLFAGTYEDPGDGRVYRQDTTTGEWEDCGAPHNSNSVMSLAVFNGELYAGTGNYRASGSSLELSDNMNPGGLIYRYGGSPGVWDSTGLLPAMRNPAADNPMAAEGVYDYGSPSPGGIDEGTGKTRTYNQPHWDVDRIDTVGAMAVFQGKLWATPLYHRGVFSYDGSSQGGWVYEGDPGVRLFALAPFEGFLYAAANQGSVTGRPHPFPAPPSGEVTMAEGGVYRYAGSNAHGHWEFAGGQAGVSQVYSFCTYESELYCGTWPEGKVFRMPRAGGETTATDPWIDVGRTGEEKEVMGMAVYNGKMYVGTLPSGEVYRYDGGQTWTLSACVDDTPDVIYRRAWSMAIHNGKLHVGTLPAGKVWSFETGAVVTQDAGSLEPGWHQIAAVRGHQDRLQLYVDGSLVGDTGTTANETAETNIDLSAVDSVPLVVGAGPLGSFAGQVRDVRIYKGALDAVEIQRHAAAGDGTGGGGGEAKL